MQIDRKQGVVWFSDAETGNIIALGVLKISVAINGLWQPVSVKAVKDADNELNFKGRQLTLSLDDARDLYEQRQVVLKVKEHGKKKDYTFIIDDVTASRGWVY